MTRSPYWHAMHRGVDAEGGGVADLQTDVMRFMAIIAFCLMAVLALATGRVMYEPGAQTDAAAVVTQHADQGCNDRNGNENRVAQAVGQQFQLKNHGFPYQGGSRVLD